MKKIEKVHCEEMTCGVRTKQFEICYSLIF